MTSQKDLREIRDSLEATFTKFNDPADASSFASVRIRRYLGGIYTDGRCEEIFNEAMDLLKKDIQAKYSEISKKVDSYVETLKRNESSSKYDTFGNAGVGASAVVGGAIGLSIGLALGPAVLVAPGLALLSGLFASNGNKRNLVSNITKQAKRLNGEAILQLKAILDPLIKEEPVVVTKAKEKKPANVFIPYPPTTNASPGKPDAKEPASRNKTEIRQKQAETTELVKKAEKEGDKGSGDALPARGPAFVRSLTREQVEIRSFLERRAIKYLVHFTDAASYDSIKRHGILSVAEAKRRGIRVTIKDSGDYNGSTSGVFAREANLDNYISLSVTRRNDKVLDAYLYRGEIDKAVVLYIDASILWREIGHDRFYCTMNAKANSVSYGRTIQNFEDMFASRIVKSNRDGPDDVFTRGWKDSNLPTHPQAEILFEGNVDPQYIDFSKVEFKE